MSLEIKQNEPLKNHSTFRIGGPVKFFVVAKSKEEILEALDYAKKNGLPFLVLGGGSNVLFKDEGFEGIVIKISNSQFLISNGIITAGAGLLLGQVVSKAAEAGLSGLEWAVGIPGTIGGGINGNCGAYGHSLSDSVESVEVLAKDMSDSWQIKKYSKSECGFVYRGSRFKQAGNLELRNAVFGTLSERDWRERGEFSVENIAEGGENRRFAIQGDKEIILSAVFKLEKSEPEKVREEMKKILIGRAGKHPPFPSSGEFFKNIVLNSLSDKDRDKLVATIPPEKIKGGKVGAGFLIEQCGLKGKQIGGAQISELHGNFLVNAGRATAKDVLAVADLCRQKVFEKFGIELEEETVII